MLNNFCFHVYAQKSLFIVENVNDFLDNISIINLSTNIRVHRAGSQLINQLVFFKISLRVWSEFLVNSVKIDGDGEATDFENYDEVENVFILSKR